MYQPAEKYESDFLSELLSEISPKEQEKTNKRMMLAAMIDTARIKKGLSKKELADHMGKRPSEITKWLSGTHNFTIETLFDLEYHLEAKFVYVGEKQKEQVSYFQFQLTQTIYTSECIEKVHILNPSYSSLAWASLKQSNC